jgi:predicted porin
MNKRVAAVAALCLMAGAAQAQSSVTIFGIVDVVMSKLNDGQSNLAFLNDWHVGRRDEWTIRSTASSRLGFRGVEDLGGGLKASFFFDQRFQPDTGTLEPRDGFVGTTAKPGFWNGQSYVGLGSATIGEVRLGRQLVPAFFVGLSVDPFGYDFSVAGAASFTRGGAAVSTSNNAVSYLSPRMGGLVAHLLVGAGEGGSAAVGAPGVGRNVGLSFQYADGPLWLGLGYNDAKREDTPLLNRQTVFGATYDFGPIKPMVGYAVGKNNVAGNPSTKTMLLGAIAPVGQGRVRALVARYDAAVGQNPNGSPFSPYNAFGYVNGADTLKLGFGYEHVLSKRTSLHAEVGSAKTEGFSRSTGFEAGIKHTF